MGAPLEFSPVLQKVMVYGAEMAAMHRSER